MTARPSLYQEDENQVAVDLRARAGRVSQRNRRPEVGGHLGYSGFVPKVIFWGAARSQTIASPSFFFKGLQKISFGKKRHVRGKTPAGRNPVQRARSGKSRNSTTARTAV